MATQKNVIENSVGSVGIGTTSPTQVLELKKTTGSAIALLNYNDSVKFNINASSAGVGYVGMVSNHPLLFVNNDTERMRLDTNGNLGIGTTSPGVKLQIQGLTRINADSALGLNLNRSATSVENGIHFSTAATTDWYFFVDNGNTNLQIQRSNELDDGPRLRFDGSNSNVLLNLGGGNVGIGLTSPTQKLEVAGFVMGGTSSYRTSIGANASGAYIYFGDTSNLYSLGRLGTYNALFNVNSYNGPISFQISDSEKVRIDSNGNLGIGTSSPAGKLDVTLSNVSLTTSAFGLDLKVTELAGGWARSNRIYNTNYTAGTTFFGAYGGVSNISYAFWTLDNPASVDVTGYNSTKGIFLNSSGNVGINTTGFTTKFSVSDGTTIAQINPYSGVAYFGTINNYPMALSVNSSEKVRIDTNGSVGIGTSSPLAKLHILGDGGSTDYVYQRWSYTGNVNTYDLLLKQTVTSGVVRYNFSMINGGTTYNDVLVLDRGCVGIGTSLPVNLLNVHGTNPFVRINNTSNGDQGIKISYNNSDAHGLHLMYNPNNAVSYIDNTYATVSGQIYGDIYFRQNVAGTMTTRMTIKADGGNVGIGTSSPAARLDVVSGSMRIASGAYAGEINFGTAAGDSTNIYLKRDNNYDLSLVQNASSGNALYLASAGNVYISIDSNNNGTTDAFIVQNNSVKSGTELFRVQENGNVGIGSSSPSAKLDVVDSGNFFVSRDASGYPRFTTTNGSAQLGLFRTGTSAGGFYIGGDDTLFSVWTTGFSRLFNINNSGNVGIGVATPITKLDIASTQGDGITLRYDTTTNYRAWIRPYWNSGTDTRIDFAINRNSGVTPDVIMSVGYGTNVGIGTTTPTQKLQVNGSAYITDVLYSSIFYPVTGITNNDLNSGDMALNALNSGESFNYDLFQFRAPNTYETQATNGGAWTSVSVPTGIFAGDTTISGGSLTIANGVYAVRFTWNSVGYRFFNLLYFMQSTAGNSFVATIEHSANGSTWTTAATSGGIGGWPAHSRYMNYWNNSSTQLYLRITLTPSWSNGNSITIYNMRYFCSYYLDGASKLYTWEYDKTFNFSGKTVNLGTSAAYTADGRSNLELYNSTDSLIALRNPSGNSYIQKTGNDFYINNVTSGNFIVQNSNTERLRINSNGSVGIGASSPQTLLQVGGETSINYTNAILTMQGGTGYGFIRMYGNSSAVEMQIDAHSSNSNAGTVGTFTNHPVYIKTNNTNKVTILADGNVGIGFTSPQRPLEVISPSNNYVSVGVLGLGVGSWCGIHFGYRENNNNYRKSAIVFERTDLTTSDAQGKIHILNGPQGSSGNATLSDAKLTINEYGNIGIGTTSPLSNLHLYGVPPTILTLGSTSYPSTYLTTLGVDAGARAFLIFGNNGENQVRAGRTVAGGYLDFYTNNTVAQTTLASDGNFVMRLAASGNIGIGTTSPAFKLDVNGAIGVGGLRFIDLSTNYFRIFEPAGNIAIYLGNAADPANYYDNTTHSFRNRGGSGTYAVIEGNGNLGIGTSSVTEAIHVYRAANAIIRLQAGGGNVSGVRMDDASSAGYLLKNRSSDVTNNALAGALYTYTDNNKAFQHIHNGTPLFTILSGGNVGIGTNGPAEKLQVLGGIKIGNKLYEVPIDTLSASDTQAQRFEIARVFIDYNDWNQTGPVEIEVRENYYSDGFFKRYVFSYGYNSSNVGRLFLVESNGSSSTDCRVVIGAAVQTSGDIYYVPIYVELDYYARADALVRTNRDRTTNASSTSGGVIYINSGPTGTNISSFDSDEVTYVSSYASKTLLGNSGCVGIGTIPTAKLDVNGNIYVRSGNGLYSNILGPYTGDLTFYTGGTEKMRILSSGGSVGIGLTSPTEKLHVSGNLKTTGTITNDGGIYYGGGSNLDINQYNNGYMRFLTNNNEKVRIDANGNVGIGTTSPIYKLDNYNDTIRYTLRCSEKTLAVGFPHGVANQKVDITFDVAPGSYVFWGNFEVEITDGYNNQLSTGQLIKVFAVGMNPATGAGPYGSALFDNTSYYKAAYGAVTINYAIDGIFFNTTTGKYYFTIIHRTSTGNTPIIKIRGFGYDQNASNNIINLTAGSVYTTNTTTYYQPAVEMPAGRVGYNGNINQPSNDFLVSGNVGIGSTSPGAKLDVVGDLRIKSAGAAIILDTSTTSDGRMEYKYNGTRKALIGVDSDNLQITADSGNFLQFRTNSSERMRITNDGNVGIGSSSPSTKLDVVGNYMSFGPTTTAARRRQTIAGEITVAGNNTTTKMFTCGSFGTGTISIIAFVTDPSNCATALFSFCHNNPSSGGVGAQTTNRLSFTASVNGVITQIYLDMGNSNPSTQYNVTVTYTGSTAPTVIFSAEGHGSQIWAL